MTANPDLGNNGSAPVAPPFAAAPVPALLAGFVSNPESGGDYPVVLLDQGAEVEGRWVVPLSELPSGAPDGAQLLEYEPNAALRLLTHAARRARAGSRAQWRGHVHDTRNKVADMLAVERARSGENAAADAIVRTVGSVGTSFLDPAAMARVVGKPRGSLAMAPERRERLERMLAALDAELTADGGPIAILVGGPRDLGGEGVIVVAAADPCAEAAARFDAEAARLTRTVAALRTADLEVAGTYDPARHDHIVDVVDWRHLAAEELAVLPVIVAFEDSDLVASDRMASLTRLLVSGRPVQVLIDVQPTRNPGAEPLGGFRMELGQLGMALRQVFVQQTSAADVSHITEGYRRAMVNGRPGLHLLCSGWLAGGESSPIGAWLTATSAIESRAHPLFRYDPDAGWSWGECLDVSENPGPDADWVTHESDDGSFTYTIADHALLDSGLAAYFATPTAGQLERVTPMHEWLAMGDDEAARHLPGVPVVVGGEPGWRLVSELLLFSVQDRLRTWRSLRELAGRGGPEATAATGTEVPAAQGELEALKAAHAEDLERVRDAAVREAMGRLASRLLLGDSAGMVLSSLPMSTPEPAKAAPPTGDTPAASAPKAEGPMAPWIDSAMCTSCNDCINMNNRLFVYDANKQAKIGDPKAGTFKQLVKAAEACPARCIHPGTPLNPNEPGLDKLATRAAALN